MTREGHPLQSPTGKLLVELLKERPPRVKKQTQTQLTRRLQTRPLDPDTKPHDSELHDPHHQSVVQRKAATAVLVLNHQAGVLMLIALLFVLCARL